MADILTQIQDEMDQILNMMQRQMAHIRIHAPPSVPHGQQRVDTYAEIQANKAPDNTQTTTSQLTLAPSQPTHPEQLSPEQFEKDIKEFAQDIVFKQQQVEVLIAGLPGLNVSEEQQIERMKQLEKELEGLEGDRLEAVKEKELLLNKVEEKIMGVGRVR
ncbi:mediator complex, subunit Med21 [Phaeosphaeria sp. MPI-PUGE-AT-0046c]|nr:mediator complex, subunit Med21 [Phaeosphaeria sp. MPI-PUGE-AT-0046c]KAH7385363.1 mediator complex, subunit Med21 [Phaeosphaeria sp. MPI-PUGE-AT-0046c]